MGKPHQRSIRARGLQVGIGSLLAMRHVVALLALFLLCCHADLERGSDDGAEFMKESHALDSLAPPPTNRRLRGESRVGSADHRILKDAAMDAEQKEEEKKGEEKKPEAKKEEKEEEKKPEAKEEKKEEAKAEEKKEEAK